MKEIPKVTVTKVVSQPTYEDFLPKFAYKLEGLSVTETAVELKSMFKEFMKTNEDLVTPELYPDTSEYRGYQQGYASAVALFNLWIDSINVNQATIEEVVEKDK